MLYKCETTSSQKWSTIFSNILLPEQQVAIQRDVVDEEKYKQATLWTL